MFGLYHVDFNYLEFLHSEDPEVVFKKEYQNKYKPFVGIIFHKNNTHYFIPLTSAKEKYKYTPLKSKTHLTIFETTSDSYMKRFPHKYYRKNQKGEDIVLISVLQYNKIIPVPEHCFSQIDISQIENMSYRNMMLKEYRFCISHQQDIIRRGKAIIDEIKSGKPIRFACNLKHLETQMRQYKSINSRSDRIITHSD